MSDDSRQYRKRKRARQEEETRRRITEAVVELHRTVGPARTKVTEVADRAGVSRMTVYNHFPTEGDLIEACSTHWAVQNPFPDPHVWASFEDPTERLRAALTELYGWYRDTEDMMGNVLRDISIVEPLREIMDERWNPYMDIVVDVLAAGWGALLPESDDDRLPPEGDDDGGALAEGDGDDGAPLAEGDGDDGAPVAEGDGDDGAPGGENARRWETELRGALRVAVDFRTWRVLSDTVGDDAEAAEVATRMVEGIPV